jgi:hypothetical protein
MRTLSRGARATRVAVTVIGALLLVAGTLWGSDDDFPFGPFRMYAGVNGPDDPAPDTRVEAVDATGRTVMLTERNTGIRRAEIEGLEALYVSDPGRLASLADAYQRLNPGAPRVDRITLVVRWHEIKGGRITGRTWDETRAVWRRAGGP